MKKRSLFFISAVFFYLNFILFFDAKSATGLTYTLDPETMLALQRMVHNLTLNHQTTLNQNMMLRKENDEIRGALSALTSPGKHFLLGFYGAVNNCLSYTFAAAGQTFGPSIILYGYQKYIDDMGSAQLMLSAKMEEFQDFTTLDKFLFGGVATVDKKGNKAEVQSILDIFDQELIKYCPSSDLQKSIIQLMPPLRVMLHLSLSRMSPANQIRATSIVMDIKKDFEKMSSIFKDLTTFAEKDMPLKVKKQLRKNLEDELNRLFKGIITKYYCIPFYADEDIYAMIDWQQYIHTEDTQDKNSNIDEGSQEGTPVFEQNIKLESVDTNVFD